MNKKFHQIDYEVRDIQIDKQIGKLKLNLLLMKNIHLSTLFRGKIFPSNDLNFFYIFLAKISCSVIAVFNRLNQYLCPINQI